MLPPSPKPLAITDSFFSPDSIVLCFPECEIVQITECSFSYRIVSLSPTHLNFPYGEGNATPLQYSCLENPMDGGGWWAAVPGVTKSQTRLSDFAFTFYFHAWRRKWQRTPVFLPGESQGRGSLVGCRLWGRTESDMTEAT